MLFAPGQPSCLRADDRLDDRADAAAELKGIAAHEIAARIGLVEFLAPQAERRAAVAVERLIDIAVVQRVRVKHQVLADQAARIGDAVGEFRRNRVQHQPRRADAVAGEDHDFGGLKMLPPLGVVIDHAGGHAVLVNGDFADPAHRAQFDAGADRERPIGDVGGGLGALRAAGRAVAEIDAAPAALIVGGGNRRIGRPPVPAELVHRLAEPRARFAQRQRRHRRLLRRIGGIA